MKAIHPAEEEAEEQHVHRQARQRACLQLQTEEEGAERPETKYAKAARWLKATKYRPLHIVDCLRLFLLEATWDLRSQTVDLRSVQASRGGGTWRSSVEKMNKMMKASRLLSNATIEADLKRPCGNGNKVHTCKDPFTCSVVRNWRTLWSCLPRATRAEKLIEAAGTHEYQFMGSPVCSRAFFHLTGVSAGSFQLARTRAASGVTWQCHIYACRVTWPPSALSMCLMANVVHFLG